MTDELSLVSTDYASRNLRVASLAQFLENR
jgi:hypothetical protein